MGLIPDRHHATFKDRRNRVHAYSDVWNDEALHGEQAREYSAGHRLNVRRGKLLSVLRKREMDLICRLVMRRETEGKKSRQEDYDYGQTTIFIVRRSGRVEQMAGDNGSRPDDSQETPT